MLKKIINFTDFNDVEQTQECYFNLTKSELMKMNMRANGGLADQIKAAIASEDGAAMLDMFEDLILNSYGVKSEDGKSFIKFAKDGHRLADDFKQTAAYDALFDELASSPDAASDFVNGVIPASLQAQLNK